MTAALQNILRSDWSMLAATPALTRTYRTRPLTAICSMEAYAALRAIDDAPCLLIRCQAPEGSLFELRGLRLSVDHDEQGTLLVLSLEDSTQLDLFTTLCADAVSAAGPVAREALSRFHERLDAWRRFLRERKHGLSREEVVGLFGELIVLERILSARFNLLSSWLAPDQGLHDFERCGHAFEVKTSLGVSSRIHISTLDQLDDSGVRRLDLVHVRLNADPTGRNLADLIRSLSALLPDEGLRQNLANALLRRGLNPDDEDALTMLRASMRSIDIYAVSDEFPRLLRSSVPLAIVEGFYAIEIRAVANHMVDVEEAFGLFLAGDVA